MDVVRSRLRIVRRLGVGALAGLAVWVLVGLPFIVFPQTGPVPEHADVVLVLGPPTAAQLRTADRLLDEGTVGAALVSVPGDRRSARLDRLCAEAVVVCAAPVPSTTRGEARLLRRYAAERGWSSAVVVSMSSQLTRARALVERCFGGPLTMVASGEAPFRGWAYQYLYQTAATVKSWALPGC